MLTEINTELFDIRGLNTDTDTKIKTSSLFCHIYFFFFLSYPRSVVQSELHNKLLTI